MARRSASANALQPGYTRPNLTTPTASRSTFTAIYNAWFESVLRWIRALGGQEADREDIAQDVFVVVRRRLQAFDGRNLAGWLYQITKRQVRDFRRLAWIRSIFTREHTDAVDDLPDHRAGPSAALERKQNQRILAELLSKLNVDRRAALVLFEIDGFSGEEIARIQGVPVNTVWKRLHAARKEFLVLVARSRHLAQPAGPGGGWTKLGAA
jgi:RNA polymerase sigma-70 factor (ECF subfamily)